MDVVIQELPTILRAFGITLRLFVVAGIASLVLGIITAAMRVSPLPPLRWVAAAYVSLVRNTPLTAVFFVVVFGLPQVNIHFEFFTFAIIALSGYTATFVAETLRSGIQAIPRGQLEAARSIGMTFPKLMIHIVMPQAARTVVAPMASVLIALFKNTSIASAFGVVEAISTMTSLVNVHSSEVLSIMFAIALGYIVIALALGRIFARLERKVAIAR